MSDFLQPHVLRTSGFPVCQEPARDIPLVTKFMRKEARHMQRRDRASGVPLDILEHLPPKKQSLPTLLLCALTSDYWGLSPTTISLSNSPDKFTRTPTAMHTIVYSLPASRGTGSLRYSNSLEPLRATMRREFRMPLVLAQGSPIFHSSCEGKLGIALE